LPLEGYEIHLGVSQGPDCARPMTVLDGQPDGATSPDGRVSGTYLHGLFGSDAYRAELLKSFGLTGGLLNYREDVDAALDDIAAELDHLVGFERIMEASGVIGR
jgi:adenosylcobyric acid synthase